jgi:general secretion pathway protein E
MAPSSPYLSQLLETAFGESPWQIVPLAMAVLFASALILRITLWVWQHRTPTTNASAQLDPSSSLRIAVETLRTELIALAGKSPPNAVRIVEQLLSTSMFLEASDIHLSPLSRELQISVRVHGSLYTVGSLLPEASALVANRLKVLSKLDLHVRHKPQDGRLVTTLAGRTLEARVSTLPTEGGERIVLRLVQGSRSIPGLEALGFSSENEELFSSLLARPQGLIFVTGPVGSGKSTTLYSALSHISQTRGDTTTIVALEDPIELRLPFATQTQINHSTGLTFATVLRSALRQDPNVLMVGEIRDRETANIAMQAGLTGHLLLTTVHSDDALGPFARLTEMGIEPFMLANSVSGSISQRLVKTLCPYCRKPSPPTSQTVERFETLGIKLANEDYFEPIGCARCDAQGYVGRTMIAELLVVDKDFRRELHEGLAVSSLRHNAIERGMIPLIEDGLRRAKRGDTSLQEILRVVG